MGERGKRSEHAPGDGIVRLTSYGEQARRDLVETIAELRVDDALAPVTIVVPSALAGVTLRRRLAADGVAGGGVFGVAFIALPELAERLGAVALAAAGRRPLQPLEEQTLVAAALAADPGPFRSAATHPATIDAVWRASGELRALDDGALDRLAGRSPRAGAVVAVHRRVRAATAGRCTDHDVVLAAADAVRAGQPNLDEIGTVVLHLPRRLAGAELDLLGALAQRGRLRVIVGRVGRSPADDATLDLLRALAGAGIPVPAEAELDGAGCDTLAHLRVVRAPDPGEECAHAVRLVRQALERGIAPDRIALVSRTASPYHLLLHDALDAAGIVHSAPAPQGLGQRLAGRTLLGLLEWPTGGYRRDHLMALLRTSPLRDPSTGRRCRSARWDRIARDAGVVEGLEQWRLRLGRAVEERRLYLEARTDPGADDGPPDERLEATTALVDFVERLAKATDPGDARGWRDLARWARRLLDSYLGGDVRSARLPELEQRARADVIALLDQLAGLDGVGPEPGLEVFQAVLGHGLERAGSRVGRFGHGVQVGRLVDAVGADLDLIVVLGVSEGSFPPRWRDDPVLPAADRAALAGALGRPGLTRAEEDRDAWAALASAPERVVMFPAADTRAQRARPPAPWLSGVASELATVSVGAGALASGASELQAEPWFVGLASFEAWLGGGGEPATRTERDVAELMAAARASGGAVPPDHPAVVAAGVDRGFEAIQARARGELGRWSGAIGAMAGLAAHDWSPTGLQEFAKCPFQSFLRAVLGVRPLDDPAGADTISAADRGSLVHDILERFVRDRLGRPPGTPWTAADREALLVVADEVEEIYRGHGRTGRDVLWRAEYGALRRHLGRILDAGTDRLHDVTPHLVEHAFGREGDDFPAVEVRLDNGRTLRFVGRIDRVDRSLDGRRLVVLDYKTGRPSAYEVLDPEHAQHDIVARGTLLQLPIYALAAQAAAPEADQVEAYYWFVGARGSMNMLGGPIDDRAGQRFREVLTTIVDTAEAGLFPARPGDDDYRPGIGETFTNCLYCEFDRVCPTNRGEQWVSLRTDPRLARYVALAEGQGQQP